MKKFAMLAVTALAVLSLTGCIQMHSDTTIEKDGSGTASLTLSLSPTMLEAMEDMKDMDMGQGQEMDVPELDQINKEELEKACKGHGVKVKKFQKDTTEGRMNLDLVLEFKDLKGLSYVMGNIMGENPGDGMGIFETADGNFILKKAFYDFPPEPAKDTKETEPEAESSEGGEGSTMTDEEKAQKQMELMGKMMGAMAELDVKFTITVPGEVIESNAPIVEEKTSTWAINAGNLMSQEQTDPEPVIIFSSKGLKIKPLKE